MFKRIFITLIICFTASLSPAQSMDLKPFDLKMLEQAYPESIQHITSNYILWKDGSRMQIRGSFSLMNKITAYLYHVDHSLGSISKQDVMHDRYEPFFKKMYGQSASDVKKNLVTVYWMPKIFGTRYPLRVTTINGIDQKLRRISAALEKLPPSYFKYLANPAGGFYWRKVAGQSYLSAHSFGIAIDINSSYANYWLWDYEKAKRPFSELGFHNRVPLEIVQIFEKEGFFWGGRWYYYDTMHFEYRPELFLT